MSQKIQQLPLLGLFMFAFFSPISISIAQISIGIAFLSWLIFGQKKIFRTPLDLPILLFLLTSLISVTFSFNFKTSITGLKEECWVIIYFLVIYILKYAEIKKALFLLLLGSSLSAFYGLSCYLGGGWLIPFLHNKPLLTKAIMGNTDRVGGFFHFYMTFANYQSLIFLLFFPLILYWDKQNRGNSFLSDKKCLLVIICLAIIFIAIIFSFTRGAWIAIFCSLFLFLIGHYPRQTIFSGLILLVATGIFISLFSHQFLSNRIIKRSQSIFEIKTWGGRPLLWLEGIRLWQKSPLTGIGIDNYENYAFRDRSSPKEIITTCHAHSNYSQFLSERGILGLLAYFFLLFSIFKEGILIIRARLRCNPFAVFVTYGLLMAFVSWIISGVSEYTYGDSELVMLFWFLVALLSIINKNEVMG